MLLQKVVHFGRNWGKDTKDRLHLLTFLEIH